MSVCVRVWNVVFTEGDLCVIVRSAVFACVSARVRAECRCCLRMRTGSPTLSASEWVYWFTPAPLHPLISSLFVLCARRSAAAHNVFVRATSSSFPPREGHCAGVRRLLSSHLPAHTCSHKHTLSHTHPHTHTHTHTHTPSPTHPLSVFQFMLSFAYKP